MSAFAEVANDCNAVEPPQSFFPRTGDDWSALAASCFPLNPERCEAVNHISNEVVRGRISRGFGVWGAIIIIGVGAVAARGSGVGLVKVNVGRDFACGCGIGLVEVNVCVESGFAVGHTRVLPALRSESA